MFEKFKTLLKESKPLQLVLTLVAGVAIGALFYPTKHIEETVKQKYEEEMKHSEQVHSEQMKQLQETFTKNTESYKKEKKELSSKVTELTQTVHDLKSKQKTAYYKVVKPDGTVEVRRFTESEVTESTTVITQIQKEFKEKVDSIENKWESIHKERVEAIKKVFDKKEEDYKKQIAEFESKKVIDINPRRAGLEVGAMSNGSYYLHPSYDLFGPLFLGVHVQLGTSNAVGGGVGFRF